MSLPPSIPGSMIVGPMARDTRQPLTPLTPRFPLPYAQLAWQAAGTSTPSPYPAYPPPKVSYVAGVDEEEMILEFEDVEVRPPGEKRYQCATRASDERRFQSLDMIMRRNTQIPETKCRFNPRESYFKEAYTRDREMAWEKRRLRKPVRPGSSDWMWGHADLTASVASWDNDKVDRFSRFDDRSYLQYPTSERASVRG
jgi:hypothetical protein